MKTFITSEKKIVRPKKWVKNEMARIHNFQDPCAPSMSNEIVPLLEMIFCHFLTTGHNLRADCQWHTLVPLLNWGANAALASVKALV